ncbi:MAG: acyl-CoA dehydrogenase family protein, partial [Saccharopolyspora sp.]|uniref:acyl-CoA dehydrogenase family protein n=1 Tax=Saccharopolyspora sp. TaxID=33915 RepID=UPI0025D81FB5
MAIAITEVQQDVRESVRAWSQELDTAGIREGGCPAPGPWWKGLAEIGVFSIALPEAVGGAGAGVADLAAALEAAAEAL